ncbi:hypothetical protein [Metabacillus sp. SLBN-84]
MTHAHNSRFRKWVAAGLSAIILSGSFYSPTHAEEPTGIEDGSIKNHELFEFEAFIKHDDVADGTEPFDNSDESGNDSSEHNKIVRSFDTVTYPLKITINPKRADQLENIKLKISGTLKNGITDDRVNAKFAVGGTEDMANKTVSFVQDYTIARTGNSIMIPVTIEVQGSKDGVTLTPDLKVEVESVDGEKITGVSTAFTDLPGVTTSAQVNIKPYINSGLAGQGIPYYPYAGISGDDLDKENTHAFSLSWGVEKLPGKTDMRGATFPDPKGTIKYKIEMEGNVAWDALPHRNDSVPFDFERKDEPFLLFDHQPINQVSRKIGQPNMLADGMSYQYSYAHTYSAPQSKFPDLKPQTIKNQSYRMVWDSGDWGVSTPDIARNKVTYEGTNTGFVIGSTFPQYRSDGYTGSPLYGVQDKVFSSHSFIVKMANEYRIGGPNNEEEYANNAYYRAYVILTGYEDENGNELPFNKRVGITFSERNNPNGSYDVQNTFFANPSRKELGTPNVGWSEVSKGDASTLLGEDVFYNAALGKSVISYGGYRAIFRWNTDAFELTKEYASTAEINLYSDGYYTPMLKHVRNNKQTQEVLYGVAKFQNNEFANFTSKGIDDYDWYKTYDEAIVKGPVGSMQMNVTAPVGPKWQGGGLIPLKVKHDNIGIGAITKDGSAAIGVTNFYPYPKEDRSVRIDVTKNRSYHNPAIWDETGTMTKKQSPAGGSVNFETLAIVPAETASILESDKTSYYNSETIHWTAKNSIVLPRSGVPDDLDAGVKVTHTLPKGLNYKVGSGKIGNAATDPEVVVRPDGTTDLVWSLLVSNSTHKLENITFDTTINPFALTASGVQSSIAVKSVIESDLDRRKEHLRTYTKSVTVLKVGMVGIYESIDKTHGDKNSEYTVTLSPYTTIEDEEGVTGLTHLPLSGDTLGSDYDGTAAIKSIDLKADRVHQDKSVSIYLNRSPVHSDKPQDVDVTEGGWYKYTGDPSQLDGAVSLLFHVDGKMTNKDSIEIDVTVETRDNAFGDQYLNETVINSDTDYRLSPVSNRVRYTIRADLELALERFQIYTNKADRGLPTSTRVAQTVLDQEAVKDKTITLAIYDTGTGEKVTEKTYKQRDLRSENPIRIPADGLNKADKRNYEVRIEGYDEDTIWVKDGEGAIDTDGYTSKEGTLTLENAEANGDVKFKGVVMTERELGGDMASFHEEWVMKKITEPVVKSGYGYSFNPKLNYSNELLNDVKNRIEGVNFAPGVSVHLDHNLIDKSLEYYDPSANYRDGDRIQVNFNRTETPGVNKLDSSYKLPQTYLEQGTGLTFTGNQKENGEMRGTPLDAGQELYVPVWINRTGAFDAVLKNREAIGSHFMNVDLLHHVHVPAYMFNHTDSETSDEDELLLHPVKQADIPEEWNLGQAQ